VETHLPRDWTPVLNLCNAYNNVGQFEKALENCLQAQSLDPNSLLTYVNLSTTHLNLARFDDTRRILDEALTRGLGGAAIHVPRFALAFAMQDPQTMDAERRWAADRPEGTFLVNADADLAVRAGQLRRSRVLRTKAVGMNAAREPASVASIRAQEVLWEASSGFVERARTSVPEAVPADAWLLLDLAVAVVLAGDRASIDRVFATLPPPLPNATPFLPPADLARAFRDVVDGETSVLDRLAPTQPDVPHRTSWRPTYLRGLMELRAGRGAAAAAHFQRIIDRPYIAATSPVHALAHVHQARAHVLAGDTAKAMKAYEEFFAIWKDADPDVPLLLEARAEYARLRK
jgi:tetratricopeptide (TPR) repeat protein